MFIECWRHIGPVEQCGSLVNGGFEIRAFVFKELEMKDIPKSVRIWREHRN